MKQSNELRNYLIKHFLLILILVGISELFLNLAFHDYAYPWLQEVFGTDLFPRNMDLTEALKIFAMCFSWIILNSLAELLPVGLSPILRDFFAKKLEENLSSGFLLRANSVSTYHSSLYIAGLICTFFLLLIIWLLPYIIAAASFSILVSRKSAALKAAEDKKQLEYERQRNLLLSDIAHDLKTPMTTVAGYASALSADTVSDPEKQKEYLDSIYRKSMQMKDLLELLFEYVKLDSEGFSLKKEKLDLTELLRENIAEIYTDLEDAKMELTFDIPESPIFTNADRLQLSRALRNLLVNAWKHNPAGTNIHVSLKAQNHFLCLVEVSDTGVKIPEETTSNLFEPFVQGDDSRSGNRGSGLGLSITRKIISMHDGNIILLQPGKAPYTKTFRVSLKLWQDEY